MMKRAVAAAFRGVAARPAFPAQRRNCAAPAWVKPGFVQIYESDFQTETYPVDAMGGDFVIFPKLMYKLAVSEKKEDKYLAEASKLPEKVRSLPPSWTAELDIGTAKEFQDVEPGMRFVLRWMQASGMLQHLEDTLEIFQVYVNAARKVQRVEITLPGLPSQCKKNEDAAKKAAEEAFAKHFPEKKGWKLDYSVWVDPGIIDGWRVNVGGLVIEDMTAYRKAAQDAALTAVVTDFTVVPQVKPRPTVWPETIETEVLSDWCHELSLLDIEEQIHGF